MKTSLRLSMLLFFCSSFLYAQIGGNNVYEFLEFSPSARITGLAGNLICVSDDDVTLAFDNPSTLNPSMHNQIAFNHNIHLGGINHGYLAYGYQPKKWATTFHAGMQYISYGEFTAADEFMNIQGTFEAAEYALTVGAAKPVYEKLTMGANIKLISSQLESYNSLGISADVGAFYQDTAKLFSATLVLKNMGFQLTTYTPDMREKLPFDVQVGISKRLRYLPFRFGIIAHNLQNGDIRYDDPNMQETTLLLGDAEPTDNVLLDKVDNLFRHLIFNGEFLFGKRENFRLRFGYSHLQKQELSVNNLRSLAGFAFGVGLKIKRFRVEFGHGFYHLAGGTNHFTISTNINEFRR